MMILVLGGDVHVDGDGDRDVHVDADQVIYVCPSLSISVSFPSPFFLDVFIYFLLVPSFFLELSFYVSISCFGLDLFLHISRLVCFFVSFFSSSRCPCKNSATIQQILKN